MSPGLTSLANPAYVTEHSSVLPTTSPPACTVNLAPACNSTFLGSNLPVLISGPFVSNITAISLSKLILAACSS